MRQNIEAMTPQEIAELATEGPLSQEEIEDFRELRSLLRPTESLRILDDFSKWLFATAAVVGSLGAGLGISQLDRLTGTGRILYVVGVLCLAISLGSAALARTPRRTSSLHRTDAVSMRGALDEIVTFRYRLAVAASVLFVVALVLAGIAPLVSS